MNAGSSEGAALLVLQAALKAWQHTRNGDNICLITIRFIWEETASRSRNSLSQHSFLHNMQESMESTSNEKNCVRGLPSRGPSLIHQVIVQEGTAIEQQPWLTGARASSTSCETRSSMLGVKAPRRSTSVVHTSSSACAQSMHCGAATAALSPAEIKQLEGVMKPDLMVTISNHDLTWANASRRRSMTHSPRQSSNGSNMWSTTLRKRIQNKAVPMPLCSMEEDYMSSKSMSTRKSDEESVEYLDNLSISALAGIASYRLVGCATTKS